LFRESQDEIVGIGGLRGGDQLLFGGVQAAITDQSVIARAKLEDKEAPFLPFNEQESRIW
jgi:hypothetical protein